jgi:membrane associated rhomboid family serine protease
MFNFIIFVFMFLSVYFGYESVTTIYADFGFSPNYLVGKDSAVAQYSPWKVLTIFTHMYIHGGFFHIIMNMVFLLFLGMPFEEKVGPWIFMSIYFIAGIFGSLFTGGFSLLTDGQLAQDPLGIGIGASGAIFGIMGAFIATYPGEKIWFPLILIRRWPVWVIAGVYFGIETVLAASGAQDNVGHFAHIGGFIGGLFFIPVINRFKTSYDEAGQLDTLDIDMLEEFATNYELKDILHRINKEDHKEIRDVWLEEFFKKIKCPECGKKLVLKQRSAKCSCGFKIKY